MKITMYRNIYVKLIILFLLTQGVIGCKKWVAVEAPITSTGGEIIYGSDNTAIGVLNGIYSQMISENNARDGLAGIQFWTGLLSDELRLVVSGIASQEGFYRNRLGAGVVMGSSPDIVPGDWQTTYKIIYTCNAAIEGLSASSTLSFLVKKQLLGEAKFMRAVCFLQLVNLYGGVPLVLTTDYVKNNNMARSDESLVYLQIISDLKDAESLLSRDYLNSTFSAPMVDRIRPNLWAAKALLARTYLYAGDYSDAEAKASEVISNSGQYELLPNVADVFKKNSRETIWALQPVSSGTNFFFNTGDGNTFILPTTGPTAVYPFSLSDTLLRSFESNDLRKQNWIGLASSYPYSFKYKFGSANTSTPSSAAEYLVLLRIGEQYLIRAEARARQNKLRGGGGAESDVNALRLRAGLQPTDKIGSQKEMLTAILHERQVELFTEWGHRWFDLRRFGVIDQFMPGIATIKGGTWAPYKKFYPIPAKEVELNAGIKGHQNSGY